MGRHRALTKEAARRGVAWQPIAIAVAVLLVVAGWLGWTWVEGTLERRASALAEGCAEGPASLRVAVTPSTAEPVRLAAGRWNERDTVVHEHCVEVQVVVIPPEQVLEGLTGQWDEAVLGERPQAWLPDSTFWVDKLAASNKAAIGSAPESVASSPVVLALPEEAAAALSEGNSFAWGDLAGLTSAPDGWARYGKPEWGRFGVAVPDPDTNPASSLALQCALAGASPRRSGPVTTEMLTTPEVRQNLTQLAGSKPSQVPATTQESLITLAESSSVTGAPYTAVPVIEVDLYRRNLAADGKPRATQALFEVTARGPSPAADFPLVGLAGAGTDGTHIRAAQKFREFLKEPEQQRDFNEAGLRAAGGAAYPSDAEGIRWDSATTSLQPADAKTAAQIAAAWASAADGGQTVTVLVDVSRSMLEDGGEGRSRLDWVKQALHGQVDRAVAGSIGMWAFSRNLDGDKPYKQLAPTRLVADQRPALHGAIDALAPASATHLYSSLAAVYEAAKRDYVDGSRNRIVVITDGRNDGGIGFQQLTDTLRALSADQRKLPISIIAIGPDPDARELREITRTTGGNLSVMADARDADAGLGQSLALAG
jgi:Ca-activated chloride channel family protein